MDIDNQVSHTRRSGSFGRTSSISSSRRNSLRLSFSLSQVDGDVESETVSEAGDIGDRALHIPSPSVSSRSQFSLDHLAENGAVVPVEDLESISPFPTDAIIQAVGEKTEDKEIPWLLEYIVCLLYLSVFGILGVLTRYGLQKLFGPDIVGATSDQSYMYLDLPSNMVGSFLMGWFGVVFKRQIMEVSEQLGIGLTTGFLGSLTTFSGWNQKMLDLSVKGEWVFAILGIIIGLFLVAYSIIFGIETAKGIKWLLRKSNMRPCHSITTSLSSYTSNRLKYLLTSLVMLSLMLSLLWVLFACLEKNEFKKHNSEAQLFLGCVVGPFGVWIRWYLARFNGRGLGKKGMLKWIPFGTLAANVLAACMMAALATIKKAVNTRSCDTVASGLQLGLLGCLSTVSTFISEFHAMRESTHPWRAYVYATMTFLISFVLGTLIYSVPVWANGYNEKA